MIFKWPRKRAFQLAIPLGGFDARYYVAHNPDVTAAGFDPLSHYLTHGWKERRDPCAFFSTGGYLRANPDVMKIGMNPLVHFWLHGLAEGRTGWQKGAVENDKLASRRMLRDRHEDDFADIRRCLRAIEETVMWK